MRSTTVRAAVLVAAVLAGAARSLPARAQTSGGGGLGPDYVQATARDLGRGTFPGRGLPAVAPAVDSPYSWDRTATPAQCVVFSGPIPPDLVAAVQPLPGIEPIPGSPVQVGALQGAPPGAVWLEGGVPLPPGATSVGAFGYDTATPRAAGVAPLVVPRCLGPGAPPVPPDPPSAAEIWEQTPLPRAHVQASPPGTPDWPGIVNLESRFWTGALPDAVADVTLDGYVVSVTAHPVGSAWSFGNGALAVPSEAASATTPARTIYRRRGDYAVAEYVVWAGQAHLTAPGLGLDFGTVDLGTVTIVSPATHHVAEIRALLRSGARPE